MVDVGFDAVYARNLPSGGILYFCYGNGLYGKAGTASKADVQARGFGKPIKEIDVLNQKIGDFLDIENGDGTPADAPGYVQAKTCGNGLYGSVSTWKESGGIISHLNAAKIPRSQVEVWTAHYDPALGAHLCGAQCGMPAGWEADMTQYKDAGPYDATKLSPAYIQKLTGGGNAPVLPVNSLPAYGKPGLAVPGFDGVTVTQGKSGKAYAQFHKNGAGLGNEVLIPTTNGMFVSSGSGWNVGRHSATEFLCMWNALEVTG